MRLLIFSFIVLLSSHIKAQDLHFQLKNLENKTQNFNQVKGSSITVFDFWATWCKPCVQLIPKLNDLQDEYSESGVSIVGVNIDDPRSVNKVKPFTSSLGVKYPILLDTDQKLSEQLNVSAVPTLVIVDNQGAIVWIHEGYSYGDENLIKTKIDELLEAKK